MLQAAKVVDLFWRLPGHDIEVSDAKQAYIQVEMHGGPTWLCLPPEARPTWWRKKFPHLRRPVRRLEKTLSLYGHPDAGIYWEQVWRTCQIGGICSYRIRMVIWFMTTHNYC